MTYVFPFTKIRRSIDLGSLFSTIAVSDDGRYIAVVNNDIECLLYDYYNDKIRRFYFPSEIMSDKDKRCTQIYITSQKQRIFFVFTKFNKYARAYIYEAIYIYDILKQDWLKPIIFGSEPLYLSDVRSIDFTSDGSFLVLGTGTGERSCIYIYEQKTSKHWQLDIPEPDCETYVDRFAYKFCFDNIHNKLFVCQRELNSELKVYEYDIRARTFITHNISDITPTSGDCIVQLIMPSDHKEELFICKFNNASEITYAYSYNTTTQHVNELFRGQFLYIRSYIRDGIFHIRDLDKDLLFDIKNKQYLYPTDALGWLHTDKRGIPVAIEELETLHILETRGLV